MAIFHFSVKCFSRSKGDSAVAAAAYRSGVRLTDARTGEIADYTRRAGVVATSLHLPPGAPVWDRGQLWDAVEASETRKNSTVARECEVSIPHELPRSAQVALATDLAAWLVARYGVAVDCAVHEPTDKNDPRNVHAHLLMSTRVLTPEGFGAKTRVLDAAATGSAEVTAWREQWAAMCNAALERHGLAERIDHRSNEARGLAAAPTIKEGRGRSAADRRAHNDEVRQVNEQMQAALAERAAAVVAEKLAEAERLARERAERIAAEQARIEADRVADEQALAEYRAAVEQRERIERDAAEVAVWRTKAEGRIQFLQFQASGLPTEDERRRAQAQLAVAQKSNDQAQRELTKAQRDARSSRWWNPVSMYRAWVAHRDMQHIEHRAGSLATALETIERAATATHTREHVQAHIDQLRHQLDARPVPQVPALPAPPVLKRHEREAEAERQQEAQRAAEVPPDEGVYRGPRHRPPGLH